MNIETHPALHYVMMLIFYNVGISMNVLMAAWIVAQSKINSIQGMKQYFAVRWPPILIRWVICIFLFLMVWENPSVMNLEKFMPNLAAHLGMAGAVGFVSDAVWDKVLAIVLPGIQKELPAVQEPK